MILTTCLHLHHPSMESAIIDGAIHRMERFLKELNALRNQLAASIVVVLSGSMEPAFQRGDLLFLWNRGLDTQVGEIVVYNVKGKDIPIVHRVVRRYGGE